MYQVIFDFWNKSLLFSSSSVYFLFSIMHFSYQFIIIYFIIIKLLNFLIWILVSADFYNTTGNCYALKCTKLSSMPREVLLSTENIIKLECEVKGKYSIYKKRKLSNFNQLNLNYIIYTVLKMYDCII